MAVTLGFLCPSISLLIFFVSILIQTSLSDTTKSDLSYHFLGKPITKQKWEEASEVLKCWSMKGSWQERVDDIPNYAPDFDTKQNYPANSRQCWAYYTRIKGAPYAYNISWVAEKGTCARRYISQWSKQSFCRVYGGHNIMVVGDSLSTQFYQTLVLINTGDTSLNSIKCDANDDRPESVVNVRFIRNDVLTIKGVTGDQDYQHEVLNPAVATQSEWEPSIRALNISLLVLNRGLHYVKDDVLMTRYSALFTYLTSTYPDVTILLRSTPVGHAGCEGRHHFLPPLQTMPTTFGDPQIPVFYWEEIASQYNMTAELVTEKYKNVIFFDVFKMTMLRADRHGMHYNHDCLHYCFHSVIDAWVLFFLNIGQLFNDASTAQ